MYLSFEWIKKILQYLNKWPTQFQSQRGRSSSYAQFSETELMNFMGNACCFFIQKKDKRIIFVSREMAAYAPTGVIMAPRVPAVMPIMISSCTNTNGAAIVDRANFTITRVRISICRFVRPPSIRPGFWNFCPAAKTHIAFKSRYCFSAPGQPYFCCLNMPKYLLKCATWMASGLESTSCKF